MPVTFVPHRGVVARVREANIDTIVFETRRQPGFTLTLAINSLFGRSIFDVKEVLVGEMPASWTPGARRVSRKALLPQPVRIRSLRADREGVQVTRLAATAYGMVTSLGFNARFVGRVAGGVSGVRRLPWPDPRVWPAVARRKIDSLYVPKSRRLPRWSRRSTSAEHIERSQRSSIPILIGIAALSRSGRHSDLDEQLLDAVAVRVGWPLHPGSALFPGDQTGCVDALTAATNYC